MRERILFALLIGFLVGVSVCSFIHVGWTFIAFIGLTGCGLLCSYIYSRTPSAIFLSMLLCGCSVGMIRAAVVVDELNPPLAGRIDEQIEFEGVVVAEPDVRETSARLTVQFEENGEMQKVLVVGQLYPVVKYGDRVLVAGTLTLPEPFETETGRVFRYDRYLAVDGVFAVVQRARVNVVGYEGGTYENTRRTLSEGKLLLTQSLAVALSEPQSGLAAGLIAGGKQGLGVELLDAFTKAGLVHIVVLSGYNVMLVAEALLRAFRFAGRRLAACIALLSIAAFVLAAGAGPASIRAGLMAGLALFARATGRTYVVIRALLFTVFVMVFVTPPLLVFHPGFQLSIIATLGLIYGAPIVEKWFGCISNVFIRELCASTVAAQIAVLPLLLFQTGTFSLVSLPANFMALPAVPLAMALSVLAACAGLLLPAAAPLLGIPAHAALSYVILVAEAAARVPGVSISIPPFSFTVVVCAYGGMGWYVYRKTLDREVESFRSEIS